MSSDSTERAKRPYLRPAERRRQLLDAAAAVVKRDGLGALSMVAVTAEAGVSRRLVYNHFPDLPTLVRAYVADRLSSFVEESEPPSVSLANDPLKIARENLARIRKVAPEDRMLLRALLSGTAPKDLEAVRPLLEEATVQRWQRLHPDRTVDDVGRVRILLIATVGLALSDFLDREMLSADEANDIITFLENLIPGAPA
jgi:AcrR family transcriptional regulator